MAESSTSATPESSGPAPNRKLYIHEFIDIRGHHRANYMQHMAANWSPGAQVDRDQQCYGIWAVVGSTGLWPQVVNMWQEDGWSGIAASFSGETVGAGAQDPKLEKWWARAADFRSGGQDRLMEPARWSRTIEQLVADGVRGACYAHELVSVVSGEADDFLEVARADGQAALGDFGWELMGAFTTAMRNDDEALLLWAIPSWEQWAHAEAAQRSDAIRAYKRAVRRVATDWSRIVLVDAPLSPLRIGRQPGVGDQVDPGWE